MLCNFCTLYSDHLLCECSFTHHASMLGSFMWNLSCDAAKQSCKIVVNLTCGEIVGATIFSNFLSLIPTSFKLVGHICNACCAVHLLIWTIIVCTVFTLF